MNYKDAVYRYFNFSSSASTTINGKRKQNIHISGKPNKTTLLVYLLFCLFFTFLTFASELSTDTLAPKYYKIPVSIILCIITIIVVFLKSKLVFHKLEHKTTNMNIYQRDLPSNLRAAHVRMLLYDGLIDESSLASTILDLIDRGYLDLKRIASNSSKMDIFQNGEILLVRTDKPIKDLFQYEQYIIEWFINLYGDGKQVSAKQVHDNLLGTFHHESKPCEMFEHWQALVMVSFPLKKFFTFHDSTKSRITYAVFTILGFLPFLSFIGQVLAIYGLGCLMFASPLYTLNQSGVDEKDAWLDLKRYLQDFSDMKNKTVEMVSLWEFYLTYSIALGMSSIANKEIESFFGDDIFNATNQTTAKESYTNYYASNIPNNQTVAQLEKDILEEAKKYELL